MPFSNRLAVASSKGGVGKSSVSFFLAKALAQQLPNKVGLLDADIHGPSIPKLLGIEPKLEFSTIGKEQYFKPVLKDGMKVMSLGFLAPERYAILWRGEKELDTVWQTIYAVDWGDLDYLVVDLPPSSGDEFAAVMSYLKPNGAVLVTTPRLLDSLVIKTVSALKLLNVPLIGAVENFAGFVCPKCGEKYFQGESTVITQEKLNLLARIPEDPQYPEAIATGMKDTAQKVMDYFGTLKVKEKKKAK